MNLSLRVLPEEFSIHRLGAHADVPAAVLKANIMSVTRTPEELSVVCPTAVPVAASKAETGWRCIQVVGPLDFSLTGILANLSGLLAQADVSIFAISTFDTDYILVRAEKIAAAVEALQAQHTVEL